MTLSNKTSATLQAWYYDQITTLADDAVRSVPSPLVTLEIAQARGDFDSVTGDRGNRGLTLESAHASFAPYRETLGHPEPRVYLRTLRDRIDAILAESAELEHVLARSHTSVPAVVSVVDNTPDPRPFRRTAVESRVVSVLSAVAMLALVGCGVMLAYGGHP